MIFYFYLSYNYLLYNYMFERLFKLITKRKRNVLVTNKKKKEKEIFYLQIKKINKIKIIYQKHHIY